MAAADDFADYDLGNESLVDEVAADLAAEGTDCASVDLLLRMARDGDLGDVADVLGGLAGRGHAKWAGDILRAMSAPPPAPAASTGRGRGYHQQQQRTPPPPDYTAAAGVLAVVVDMGLDAARSITRNALTFTPQGPDCYDLSMVLGHMAKAGRTRQAAELVKSIAADESPEGINFKSLAPCMLGSLVDWQHADWAAQIVWQLCAPTRSTQLQYTTAGWCLAQHVFFGRPDWAAGIVLTLAQQPPPGYTQEKLLQAVSQESDPSFTQHIVEALRMM